MSKHNKYMHHQIRKLKTFGQHTLECSGKEYSLGGKSVGMVTLPMARLPCFFLGPLSLFTLAGVYCVTRENSLLQPLLGSALGFLFLAI